MINDNTLYEEQLSYFRERKDDLVKRLQGVKVGFDLFLPVHLSALVMLELKKKYTYISVEFETEAFIYEEFKDVMNDMSSQRGDSFSLKESLKAECRLAIVTDYMKSIVGKLVYPSELRRKEVVLENAIKRAQRRIDDFFSERDINYNEISDVIEIFELWVRDNGRILDLHIGRHGFSLASDKTPESILSFVKAERVSTDEKLEYLELEMNGIERLASRVYSLASDMFQKDFVMKEMGITHEMALRMPFEEIGAAVDEYRTRLDETLDFLKIAPELGFSDAHDVALNLDFGSLFCDEFHFIYLGKTKEELSLFKQEYAKYQKVKPMLDEVKKAIQGRDVVLDIIYQNDNVQFQLKAKPDISSFMQNAFNRRKTSLTFAHQNGELLRPTGEKVLTAEVIAYELMQGLDKSFEEQKMTVERAKEMLFSVLSKKEEEMFLKEGGTIIEGEENFYALLDKTSYNNVVKIPKNGLTSDNIEALCIHPEDIEIPVYDGFAAIALAVKSGDEEYVLKNSNSFRLSNDLKKKLLALIDQLQSSPLASAI